MLFNFKGFKRHFAALLNSWIGEFVVLFFDVTNRFNICGLVVWCHEQNTSLEISSKKVEDFKWIVEANLHKFALSNYHESGHFFQFFTIETLTFNDRATLPTTMYVKVQPCYSSQQTFVYFCRCSGSWRVVWIFLPFGSYS